MTITVTMRDTRVGENGAIWQAGQSYEASLRVAAELIGAGFATGTLPSVATEVFAQAKKINGEWSVVNPETGAPLEGGGGGGGATSFTDLTDAPATITPSGVVCGNDNGNALRCSDAITIGELTGTVQITENGEGGITVNANGSGGLTLTGNGSGGITVGTSGGDGALTLSSGIGGITLRCTADAQIYLDGSGSGGVVINAGAYGLTFIGTDVVATDAGATAMLINADGNNNMVVLKALKVDIGGTDYYIPLFTPD